MTNPRKRGATPPSIHSSIQALFGYCRCGCNRKTPLARYTSARRGHVKGEPLYFLRGHQRCVAPIARFWGRVTKSPDKAGCWLYGAKPHRYGSLAIHGIRVYAHRFSFELHCGSVPVGKHVLHKCDVPACVRPDHLFLGSHKDNMRDRDRKERSCKKLSHADAALIRERHADGITIKALAREFRVSRTMVGYIVNGVWHRSEERVS